MKILNSYPLIDINVIAEMVDYPEITSVAEGHTGGMTDNVKAVYPTINKLYRPFYKGTPTSL